MGHFWHVSCSLLTSGLECLMVLESSSSSPLWVRYILPQASSFKGLYTRSDMIALLSVERPECTTADDMLTARVLDAF